MSEVPWGVCMYCKNEGIINIRYFCFPINCECCSSGHSERIEYCSGCEPVMPKTTLILVDTKKLQDPIHEGLFTKGAFV